MALIVRDYNGEGKWQAAALLSRYRQYAREVDIPERDITPRVHELGDERWIYPVMFEVIKGIRAGDLACIRIGIEFIEEDAKFPFGKTLKSGVARALRRARLSTMQQEQIRRRVFHLLAAGIIPHEYRDYAHLVRTIGFRREDVPPETRVAEKQ